jgi:group I intron endonuclease
LIDTLIYKGTCLINGKVYIGLTTKGLKHRVNNHERTSKTTTRNSMIYNAIRKHGKNNFVWDVLEYCPESELEDREKFWISYFDSYHKGYNSTTGGERKKTVSPESRDKMSLGHKGQIPWLKGKKLPPLTSKQKEKLRIFADGYRATNRVKQKNRKPIRCIETGIEYESIRDCNNKTGINRLSLTRQLRGIYHTAGGCHGRGPTFHFEYTIPNQ